MILLKIDWTNAINVVSFSFTMVFVLLVVVVVVLNLFSKLIAPKVKLPKSKAETEKAKKSVKEDGEFFEGHLSAGDSAAIAMALHLFYAEVHDEESAIITIKTVQRRYSPWSSKIYGLNNLQR